MTQVLGIDIGGTGIKGAPVDLSTGTLAAERIKIPTPQPSKPQAVADVVAEIVAKFSWSGPVGITFPGVVVDGEIRTAANVDHKWIGTHARDLFGQVASGPVTVINDADAAGLAEMKFGAGQGHPGTVLLLTLGTGIGSALFTDGILVPNTEFGHIEVNGHEAEKRASEHAREAHDLSWDKWADRLSEVLAHLEALMAPSLIIIGGGISRKSDKYLPLLSGLRAEIVPAKLFNDAGIVGAAMSVTHLPGGASASGHGAAPAQ